MCYGMMIQMIEHFLMHVNTMNKIFSRQKLHKNSRHETAFFVRSYVCCLCLLQNSNHHLLCQPQSSPPVNFHVSSRTCMQIILWLTLWTDLQAWCIITDQFWAKIHLTPQFHIFENFALYACPHWSKFLWFSTTKICF